MFPKEKQANIMKFALCKTEKDGLMVTVSLISSEGELMAFHLHPRSDWERMKKGIDDTWMMSDIDEAIKWQAL